MIFKFFKQITIKHIENSIGGYGEYVVQDKISDFEIIIIGFVGGFLLGGFAAMLSPNATWLPVSIISGSILALLNFISCYIKYVQYKKENMSVKEIRKNKLKKFKKLNFFIKK